MNLHRYSQEYAHVEFSLTPADGVTLEASVDLITWRAVDIVGDGTFRILLRGPDARRTEGLLVQDDGQELFVRIADEPEDIVRSAGRITLYT